MTFDDACAVLRGSWWGLDPTLQATPIGEVMIAYCMLDWMLDWAEVESEGDVQATIAARREDLIACLSRCSPDELAACLAVGPPGLRDAALLALGRMAP